MGLTEFINNASSIFLTVIVSIITGYWVTIWHDAENGGATGFVSRLKDRLKSNRVFMGTTTFFLILLIIVIRNLILVYNVNNSHIHELREQVAKLEIGTQPRKVHDRLAMLEDYFSISEVKKDGLTSSIVYKPKKIVTFLITPRDFILTIHFEGDRYVDYTFEEGEVKTLPN